MTKTIAVLIFDGAEEMDFVGPWEVLTAAIENSSDWKVITVANSVDPVVCEKGMRVVPDATYSEIASADVVVVPGGSGARREINNLDTINWLRHVVPKCQWVTVCTGSFLLVGAKLAEGRKITTHHAFVDQLKEMDPTQVVCEARLVIDGRLVTAGGVMSGIEMALWLVEQIWGAATAEYTKNYIAYDHPPRSKIEVFDDVDQ